jgi:glycosyltransferase involved in cell wall biosynthesis
LSCLSVACWYYYVVGATKQRRKNIKGDYENIEDPLYAMPLMTHCPRELMTVSTVDGLMHRYQQLQTLIRQEKVVVGALDNECPLLVTFLRTNEGARRLTSLIMVQRHRRQILWQEFFRSVQTKKDSSQDKGESLLSWLESSWFKIVPLPNEEERGLACYRYELSVIIPLYNEDGIDFFARFSRLVEIADNPTELEFIIVNAGKCTNITEAKDMLNSYCEENEISLTIIDFVDGGGRGPCLNYGARRASGRILTFLHADTQLPTLWDTTIRKGLSNHCSTSVATFCAFSFAIDKIPTVSCNNNYNKASYHPPGLGAVETTANLRCRLFQLPYGDQCLSLPRYVFDYLGGYPDQCLMEDYELVQVLRQRCRISSRPSAGIAVEKFQILPQRCYCSSRRWQSFGVLYVTFTNSLIVQLYNAAVNKDTHDMTKTPKETADSVSYLTLASPMSPDEELFCRYYGTATIPARKHPEHSPWEIQLIQNHQKKKKKSFSSI